MSGCSDLASLLLASLIADRLHAAISGVRAESSLPVHIVPFLGLLLAIFSLQGLYPASGLSPAEELRRTTTSTTMVFFLGGLFVFHFYPKEPIALPEYLISWVLYVTLVQLDRWMVRITAVRLGAWGEPVAVIGYGPQGQQVVEFLRKHARFGMVPAVVIDATGVDRKHPGSIPKLWVAGQADAEPGQAKPAYADISMKLAGIQTAILVTSEIPRELQNAIACGQHFHFKRLILITDLQGAGSIGVTPYDLEGFLGLEVRKNLLDPWQQLAKRALDLFLVLLGAPVILPVIGLIALLVWLDSPGSVFYSHTRAGRGGKSFKMWKFRSMRMNNEQAFHELLENDPEARRNWEANQKLKNDPRITRTGRLLREWSLDELPQLWNVLTGKMSLVGPRPIPVDEAGRRKCFHLYRQVRPGLTGLWQVSGRCDLGYDSRDRYDEYYVRNWSIWLDIYILLRTVWAVLKRKGAY